MQFCPNCGVAYEGSPNWCAKCGGPFRVSPSATQPAAATAATPQEKARGLGHLRESFLVYLAAGIIAPVPFFGMFNGLLPLVGIIAFVIGWRALGRSTSPSAAQYKSTAKWFIYAIVIVFASAIGGIFIMVGSIISSTFTPVANPASPAFTPISQNAYGEFYAIQVPLAVFQQYGA